MEMCLIISFFWAFVGFWFSAWRRTASLTGGAGREPRFSPDSILQDLSRQSFVRDDEYDDESNGKMLSLSIFIRAEATRMNLSVGCSVRFRQTG